MTHRPHARGAANSLRQEERSTLSTRGEYESPHHDHLAPLKEPRPLASRALLARVLWSRGAFIALTVKAVAASWLLAPSAFWPLPISLFAVYIACGFAWRAHQVSNARLATIEALALAIWRIQESPDFWPPHDFSTRRIVLRRFPYLDIYRIESDRIVIVAVAHTSRRPGYWRDRLNDEG